MSDEQTESSNSTHRPEPTALREDLSVDTLFQLLAHRHRRAVLSLLMEHDRAVTLRDLRNEIVENEEEMELTEIPQEQITQTAISLHHVHVPMLADEDLVTHDPDRGIVEATETLRQLEPVLDQVEEITSVL